MTWKMVIYSLSGIYEPQLTGAELLEYETMANCEEAAMLLADTVAAQEHHIQLHITCVPDDDTETNGASQ